MRLLFYTATTAFLALAGIFAFYALQPPDHIGAARVVLSIEANDRSANALTSESVERHPAAEPATHLTSDYQENTASDPSADGTSHERLESGGLESLSSNKGRSEEPQPIETSAAESPTEPPHRETLTEPAEVPAESQSTSSNEPPPLLPGTTITGFEGSRSSEADNNQVAQRTETQHGSNILRNTALVANAPVESTETGPDQQLAALSQSTATQEKQTTSSPAGGAIHGVEPSTQDSSSQEPPVTPSEVKPELLPAQSDASPGNAAKSAQDQKLKAEFDAFMASLNEKKEQDVAAIAAEPPPPFPLKRPTNIPTPVRTAANSWAGTQFAINQAVSSKPPPRVAILLRGLGRDERNSSEAVTKLPSAISMAFMPYTGTAQQWSRKARELGHEVIIQLPLEPSDYPRNNPGPETLVTSAGADENISRMRSILSRFEGYSGVTNFLGGRLLQSQDALRPILENIKSQGLIYVGEGNNSHAVLRRLAGEIGLRYGGADVVIDAHPAPEAIQKALDQLIILARKQGSAIGIGFASRTTIEQLVAWSQTVSAKGVTLVPVGVLAHAPSAS